LPFQTDTIAESYWLTTAPSTLTKTRTQAVSMSDVPGLVSSIAAHNAGINFVRATQRTTRMEQFVKSIRSATTIKGVSIK
jgi:GTPase involved in cell partitioning and DNA repair